MNRTVEREFDQWLRRVDTAFTDTVRADLDVERALARVKDSTRRMWPGADLGSAAEGDAAAAEQLLAAITPVVLRYCRARIGKRPSFTAADEVAREVCVAVLRALPSYQDQAAPAESFLPLVYNIAADRVAAAQRAQAPQETDGTALDQRLSRLLSILPPAQREIVVLRVVVGLSAQETAEALGMTPGAVRVAQHRALARLRKAVFAGQTS